MKERSPTNISGIRPLESVGPATLRIMQTNKIQTQSTEIQNTLNLLLSCLLEYEEYCSLHPPYSCMKHYSCFSLQVKHDLNSAAAAGAGLKSSFNLLLWEPKPVRYERLDINLSSPQELDAQRPRVPVPEYPDHIDLPAHQES